MRKEQTLLTREQFKRELDAYIIHWNTRRRQIRLEGHTPGGVPEHVPRGLGLYPN